MLQNRVDLVLLDALGHHIHQIAHDSSAKLQVEVRFDTLLRDCLGNTLAVSALELTREQVTEPALQERDDSAHEEQPYPPGRGPETATRTLTNGTCVESVVDEMLQVLAGTNLVHELVLVSVHTGQLTNMVEGVQNTIRKLEGINIAQTILNLSVNNKLGQTQNLTHQMESVSET
jgi:hypothetical protein